MRIALDIDGVMNYIEKFQMEYGIPWFREKGYEVVNPNGFDVKDIFGCSEEIRREFWKSHKTKLQKGFWNALIFDFAKNSEMRPGFEELVKALNEEENELFIITERYGTDKYGVVGRYFQKLVIDWLKSNNINIEPENIIFVSKDKTKEEIYLEKNIDVILEDKIENIMAIENNEDLYAIVFNAQYNKDYNNVKIYRVNVPQEVKDKLRLIEEKKEEKAKQKQIKRPNMFFPSTGKASIDRVYRQYIDEEDETIDIPKKKMWEHLRDCTKDCPDAIILDDNMGNKITFGEFNGPMTDLYAHAFKAYGIQEGDHVVIGLPNIPEFQLAKFGLNKIGAIPVFVNPLSSEEEIRGYLKTPSQRGKKPKMMLMFNRSYDSIKKVMSDSDIEVENYINVGVNSSLSFPYDLGYALTESKNDPSKRELKENNKVVDIHEFIEKGKKNTDNITSEYKENECAVIYYTGGTSSNKEKAVMLSNENCIAIAQQFTKYIKGSEIGDVTINAMPWFHVYGDNQIFYFAACNKMKNVPVAKFNRKKVESLFKKNYPIANYNGVPTFFRATFANLKQIERLKNVKNTISGGDYYPINEIRESNKILKRAHSSSRIKIGYGITEGAGGVCYTVVGEDEEGCIGIPTPSTNIKIVKPGTEEELNYGESGEICFSGPSVTLGYLNDKEETNKALRKHCDGKIWFHSGDMGYAKENGKYYFSTRIKRMLIVSGENVYPNKIENFITNQYEDVIDQCFVIGRMDANRGEVPVAKIKLKEGINPTEEIKDKILNSCKENFKNKKYWPTTVDFIKYVPQTKMSKADYRKLDDPKLIIDTVDKKVVHVNKLEENYDGNKFYRTFSRIYSPIYTKAPIYGRKVEYIGKENIPEVGSGIITMNHINAQDQNAILASVDRIISLPAKQEYFEKPISRYFMEKMDMIPVDRYGDGVYAKGWEKGLINTIPLKNFEEEQPIISEILNYIDCLPIKQYSKPKDIVEATLEFLESKKSKITEFDKKIILESAIERIENMPTSGEENGYGRALTAGKKVEEKLKRGRLVAVFPEGKRNNDFYETGKLLPFHDGAIYWSKETNSPIIPTVITGEHKAGGNLLVRSGLPIIIDEGLNDIDIKDATLDLRNKMYELLIMNLVAQESNNNTNALTKIIENIHSDNTKKDIDLLYKIETELKSNSSERNDKILKKI